MMVCQGREFPEANTSKWYQREKQPDWGRWGRGKVTNCYKTTESEVTQVNPSEGRGIFLMFVLRCPIAGADQFPFTERASFSTPNLEF